MRFLGQTSAFPDRYAPEVLEAVPRALARESLGISGTLPFDGEDIWNAYELTWLAADQKIKTGLLRLSVPAASLNLVESKSLKLYLGSLTFETFESISLMQQRIERDVGTCVGASVQVAIADVDNVDERWDVSPLPQMTPNINITTSNSLRSLCPVTGQPDHGSVIIMATGARPSDAWLDSFIVEHRNQEGFHEECCERLFMAITSSFDVTALSVGCFYTRRGGIDINPIRRSTGMVQSDPAFLHYRRTVRQ